MIGAGTIVKVITAVAILAAISFFVIKPIIDTSEKTPNAAAGSTSRVAEEAAKRTEKVQLDVARGIALSAAQSARAVGDAPRADRILACIGKSDTSDEMKSCRAL